ncbi:MAG TPA: hypothetical protein VEV38_00980 [Candidatus Eremiobacteraceae bacterium]|nr:hypothetical protein [Candidatus Eremiobacteraceae bacterium]
MILRRFAVIVLVAATAYISMASAADTNLLANPNFAAVSTSGEQTVLNGAGATGDSAAAHWTVYNTGDGSTTTELMPSTHGGGKSMIHVVTTDKKPNSGSGLVQAFLPVGTGPGHVTASALIFIKTGTVFIGTGNGGNTGIDARTSVTGKWVELKAHNGVSPANMFIIYGQSPGAEFYVDSASVEALAPGTPTSVSVTKAYLEADPIEYVGHCPTTIHFYGTIGANGPTSVLFSFKRNDGSYVAQPKLIFADAGSRPVQMSWKVGNYYAPSRAYPGWADIEIAQPNKLTSNKARFSVTCKNT